MSDEQDLAARLRDLPPAPEAWVAAAERLPATRQALDDIERQVLEDAEERAKVTADLEAALRRAGVEEPTRLEVDALRRRLDHG